MGKQKAMLWFDVGIKRYTTFRKHVLNLSRLWFDVGIKRYTTHTSNVSALRSCGLM